jgi:acyl-coenzyme A thioesterase PaaI-like protein
MSAPLIEIQEDWEIVTLPFQIGSGRTIFSGAATAERLRLSVFRSKTKRSLVGRVWFGDLTDGPPGHVHGGAVAYVLDEAMGSAAWMRNFPVVAAKLSFEYLRMSPLKVELAIEAEVLQTTDRRVFLSAELRLLSGEVCVRASGEFARLSKAKLERLAVEHGSAGNADDFAALQENKALLWATE